MVSSHHHDRHLASQPGERRGYMKSSSGYDPRVGEPEIEEVSIDEQAVAQSRHGIEELEQRLLHAGRRHA
jgi:hypothetical protein